MLPLHYYRFHVLRNTFGDQAHQETGRRATYAGQAVPTDAPAVQCVSTGCATMVKNCTDWSQSALRLGSCSVLRCAPDGPSVGPTGPSVRPILHPPAMGTGAVCAGVNSSCALCADWPRGLPISPPQNHCTGKLCRWAHFCTRMPACCFERTVGIEALGNRVTF
jgi:hypothetical protein